MGATGAEEKVPERGVRFGQCGSVVSPVWLEIWSGRVTAAAALLPFCPDNVRRGLGCSGSEDGERVAPWWDPSRPRAQSSPEGKVANTNRENLKGREGSILTKKDVYVIQECMVIQIFEGFRTID